MGIRFLYIGEIVDNQCLSFLLIILIFYFRSLAKYFFDKIFSYTCVHRDYKNRYMMSTRGSATSLLDWGYVPLATNLFSYEAKIRLVFLQENSVFYLQFLPNWNAQGSYYYYFLASFRSRYLKKKEIKKKMIPLKWSFR